MKSDDLTNATELHILHSMNKLHNCSAELRNAKLAATPARIAAMQLFESQTKPIDALSLVDTLAHQGVDRVTAFRILKIFVEKGLLHKVNFLEDKALYELASRGDHHHLVCRNCGNIEDIQDSIVPQFIDNIKKKSGFVVTNHILEFFGICKNCLNKPN